MNIELAQAVLDGIVRCEKRRWHEMCPLCRRFRRHSCKTCPAYDVTKYGHEDCLDRPITLGYKILDAHGWTWEWREVVE